MHYQPSPVPPTGVYLIINKLTGLALDSNHSVAKQTCASHPRTFMYQPSPQSMNHHWLLEHQPNTNNYMIKTVSSPPMALDGNTNVPQHLGKNSHPAPFLYTPVPSAANHRWNLVPVSSSGNNVFMIVNEANGLALDGNVSATGHADHVHQSAFLYAQTPHAPNHHWMIQPVHSAPSPSLPQQYIPAHAPVVPPQQQPLNIGSSSVIVGPASGNYVIVNKESQLCLDANVRAAKQTCNKHERVFVYKANHKSKNHHWHVEHVQNGEYILTTMYHGKPRALDGNTNVPQHSPSHPAPFLYDPHPEAANHRWRLVPVQGVANNTYTIINASNGLALDGKVAAIPQLDEKHRSPFLWNPVQHSGTQLWEFQPIKAKNGGFGTIAGAMILGGLVAGPIGMAVAGGAAAYSSNQAPRARVQHIAVPNQNVPVIPQQTQYHPSAPVMPAPQPQHMVVPQTQLPPPIQPIVPMSNTLYPQIIQAAPQPMDNTLFLSMLESLKREPFESNRKDILTNAALFNFFTCIQLSQVFSALQFSSERIHAAQVIIPRVLDRHNAHSVIGTLPFQSERESVAQLFSA